MLSACAVATVVVVWVKGWQEQVGDKEPTAEKLSQAAVVVDKKCEQLEYRYKHFRSLPRRHIATIYFLNGDRQDRLARAHHDHDHPVQVLRGGVAAAAQDQRRVQVKK